MAKTIPLSIVTPEKPVWQGEVDSLVVPAFDGQLGILPGHAPLLAQLKPGTVVMKSAGDTKVLAVSGGFVEVHGGKVALFAESAELAEEIDAERARQALEKARGALKGGINKLDAAALGALERALARLRVAEFSKLRKASQQKPHHS